MNPPMQASPWLEQFLEGFEKFRPTSYRPTPKDVWTAGFGHTSGVTENTTCTLAEARAWLAQDALWACSVVNNQVHVTLTQHEFDALSSLVFNIGSGNFIGSTMLRLLNQGSLAGASAEFPKWDKQAGAVLAGLLARRNAEERYFDLP